MSIDNCANYFFLILVFTLMMFDSLSYEQAQAHVFLPDKNASLLAIINQLKAELELIRDNLNENSDINGYNSSNLASEHLADAIEIQNRNNDSPFIIPELNELRDLIKINSDLKQPVSLPYTNDIINNASEFLDSKIVSDIDARDLKNSTIQALNIANITDEVLREYAMAYNIEPVIARNTSAMLKMNMPNMGSSMSADSSPYPSPIIMGKNNTQNSLTMNKSSIPYAPKIVNISNYQNAQALAIKTLVIFRQDLEPLELPNATSAYTSATIRISSISGLEEGLSLLIKSINEKKPYGDIMQIIHGPVHTNLFLGYNLKMIAD